jgi:hypothetical protein
LVGKAKELKFFIVASFAKLLVDSKAAELMNSQQMV